MDQHNSQRIADAFERVKRLEASCPYLDTAISPDIAQVFLDAAVGAAGLISTMSKHGAAFANLERIDLKHSSGTLSVLRSLHLDGMYALDGPYELDDFAQAFACQIDAASHAVEFHKCLVLLRAS